MILRWVILCGVLLVAFALGLIAWVYGASERHLRSFPRPPEFTRPIAEDAAAVARGEHLVRTRGCRGCHGADLSGRQMWGFAVAPNLATYARDQSAAALEAAVRHGIGHDGRALYSMPSYNFIRLTDADLADMIAALQAAPVVQSDLPAATLPWSIRYEIAMGRDAAIPQYLDRVPQLQRSPESEPELARGEYLAMTTCNECHGFSLRADTPWEDESAPNLIIMIGAYGKAEFARLMREGIALGGRELEMMSPVARSRFSHFTDTELDDLYAYLRDEAARDRGKGSAGQQLD